MQLPCGVSAAIVAVAPAAAEPEEMIEFDALGDGACPPALDALLGVGSAAPSFLGAALEEFAGAAASRACSIMFSCIL